MVGTAKVRLRRSGGIKGTSPAKWWLERVRGKGQVSGAIVKNGASTSLWAEAWSSHLAVDRLCYYSCQNVSLLKDADGAELGGQFMEGL